MIIRSITPFDIERIKRIHERHYKTEFDLPNLFHAFHGVFAVTDDSDNIITVGGVRPLAEVVAVTDKDFSVRDRREALYKLLDGMAFIAGNHNYDAIHCFVQDRIWLSQLLEVGFRHTKGTSLLFEVNNGKGR